MHDALTGPKMNHESKTVTDKIKQILVVSWGIGSFVWYFHRFLPAFAPILGRLLHRLWR